MSKRGHITNQTGPLPPFAENLVFWAPLTEDDLTDHISGVSPTTDTGCSVTWDSVKQMYKLSASGGSSSANSALIYNLSNFMTDRHGCTLVIDVEEISRTGDARSAMLSSPSLRTQQQGYNSAAISRARMSGSSTTQPVVGVIQRLAITFQQTPSGQSFYVKNYIGGSLIRTESWGADLKFSAKTVTLCQLYYSGTTQYSIYVKNARIYDREMTAQEVAQL